MGNSQTVLACHCITRLFFRDLFPDPRCAKTGPGACYFSCRAPVGSILSARSQLDRCGPSLQFLQRNTAAGREYQRCALVSLTLSRETRPPTGAYPPSSQTGSRNFTNQRRRWSRRVFQNHKPFTSVGTAPTLAEPQLRGQAVAPTTCLVAFQGLQHRRRMLVQADWSLVFT